MCFGYRLVIIISMINDKIKSLIDCHDCISFDIFDTLLVRPYMNPYHFVRHMEQYTGRTGFTAARMAAEHRARSCGGEDITFDAIYANIDASFRDMRGVEIEFESRILRPRPGMIDVYNYARQSGKKIAIISDMYLSSSDLGRILRDNGYDGWDWMYISGEHNRSKYTGNLFKTFLTDTGLCPGAVLHIGDSVVSDVQNAQRCGIDALHVPSLADAFLSAPQNRRFCQLYRANPDSLTISMILMRMAHKMCARHDLLNNHDLYWADFAYCIGGPIAYGLTRFSVDTALARGAHDLLFIARDGFVMHKIANMLLTGNSTARAHYVYAQRMLHAKCLLSWGDEHNANVVLDILRGTGTPITDTFDSYAAKDAFIKSHLDILRPCADKNLSEYKQYLANFHLDTKSPIAIIDSGAATFSAQRLLRHALGDNVFGVYSVGNIKNAQRYDIDYVAWAPISSDIDSITSLIEFVLMSPEGPVIDLINSAPVYQKNSHLREVARNRLAEIMIPRIVDFSRDILDSVTAVPVVFSPRDVNEYISAFCSNMSKLDTEKLGDVWCASNASHTEYNQSLLAQINRYNRRVTAYYLLFLRVFTRIAYRHHGALCLGRRTPFISWQERDNIVRYRLFGVVPLMRIKKRHNRKCYDLFGFLRIARVKCL